VARARATDPGARYQHAAELRDDLRRVAQTAAAPVMAREVSVDTGPTGATDAMGGTGATAPATVGVTTVVMPPAAPPPPKAHRRQKPVKPLKPLKPPKPKRMPRQRTVRPRPARAERAPRRWRASHVAVILAAPLLLLAGGVVAYVKLNEHAPVVAVPDVVDRDVFGAIAAIKHAGFEIEAVAVDSPRPGGIILSQRPANGHELEQGSTVHVTVSRTSATVPDVVGLDVDAARVALAQRGLPNVTLTDDYRDDIDPGTVVSSTPAAGLKSSKGNAIVLVIARDPHVAVPNLVTLDQATAVEQLQARGLEPAIQTASSKTVPAGQVIRVSPSASTVVVRGSTVTLTVSSGPKLVAVPPTVGLERDEAVAKLEDRGFAVVVTTAPSSSDRAGTVMAQSPAGGQAPDGSTVTITVGFGGSKR
jgi:serine/threonine-protein kinase